MNTAMKIGIVGLDSSHSVEYARLWHDTGHTHHVPGAQIVAAYPGGSADWELSYSRVAGFRATMESKYGIPVYDTIEQVVEVADAMMILTIDGRVHWEQFEIVAKSGKPVYIDKPLALSGGEVDEIEATAKRTGTRVFSSSVWRWATGLKEALGALDGPCRNAAFQGQWPLFEGIHGWMYYGIHQVELLFAAMGPGCHHVTCARVEGAETITGFWPDGRIGTIGTNHDEGRPYTGWLQGENKVTLVPVRDTMHDRYSAFLRAAMTFYAGGPAPVLLSETRETIKFMEAAEKSAAQGGAVVEVFKNG